MSKPSKRLGSAFMRIMSGYGQVHALLSTASISLPAAQREVLRETVANLQFIATKSPMKDLFGPGGQALEAMGGFSGAVKSMANNQMTFYLDAITTAALIFSHAVLDAAVTDFCRIIAEVEPESWDSLLDSKPVKFEQVRSLNVEEIRHQVLVSLFDQLEHEPLPRRIERLLGVCRPSGTTLNSEGYTFDADRIRSIDDQRHKLVHGGASAPTLQKIKEEVNSLASG